MDGDSLEMATHRYINCLAVPPKPLKAVLPALVMNGPCNKPVDIKTIDYADKK